MNDTLKTMLLITAAQAERHGIPNPTGHDFSAEELATAREGLEEAERMLDDMPTLREEREMRDAKLDSPHRGAVPRTWSR